MPLWALVCFFIVLTATPALAADGARDGQRPAAQARDAARRASRALPRLDAQLNRLVAELGAPRSDPAAVAREAPLARDSSVAVKVRLVDGTAPATLAAFLGQRGALVANVGNDGLEAYVPVAALPDLAAQPAIASVRALLPPQAQTTNQATELLGSPAWNAASYTGAGVKVGVIDIGFVGLSALLGNELPPTVVGRCYAYIGAASDTLTDCEQRDKHGTAVAESLIDVAPGITLYISNPQSTYDLNQTVTWMADQGVTVINHSVGWGYEGPGDGTSRFSDSALAAIDTAVARGIVWINSVGNEGQSTWTGPLVDADADGLLEFGPGAERNGVSVFAGATLLVQLRWDDAWGRAARDLDLFLYDSGGNIVRASADVQSGLPGQDPYEWFTFVAPATATYQLAVEQLPGADAAWAQLQVFSGQPLQYNVASGSVSNPAESANPGMLSVGAAYWNASNTIEPYSSQGPTRDGRLKPELVAADGADSAVYGAFYGTSAATPQVAGFAALVKQRYGVYTPRQVVEYLIAAASPRGAVPNNTWGYGFAAAPAPGANPNPLPVVSAVEPASLAISDQPQALTVTGANFVQGAVARWNGVDLPTTFVSATQLTVVVPTSELSVPARVDIYVVNPTPGGGFSNVVTITVTGGGEPSFAATAFADTWNRTDEPVASIAASRTWIWGPGPFSNGIPEQYAEGANNQRLVQYFDKSRMEITTDPAVGPDSTWYVTNGLLSKELITGAMQTGDNSFVQRGPAAVNVAGDQDDPDGPTYASFSALLGAPAAADGAFITQRVARDGTVTDDPSLAAQGVSAAYRVTVPGIDHQVASPFWEFMNSSGLVTENGERSQDLLFANPFYATGYPITEAYWATVKVGGVKRDVLLQCFERRCLTYTPDNPPGWQVEAGNVGRHYYAWRYGS